MNFVLVFIGGGIGSALRYGVDRLFSGFIGDAFPLATLFVNVIGSFAMGLIFALLSPFFPAQHNLRLFLATGLLGGFTTFSAFSLETIDLWQRGAGAWSVLYVASSLVFALGGLAVGLALGRAFI